MAPSAPTSIHPPTTTQSSYSYGSLHRPANKMSITQTFYLAHKARGKLSSEATRSDHNLRLLVGHANLLDSLMIHLAHAEAEQERWYYNTVRGNEEWQEAENYGSLAADYDSESDSESESDFDSEEESEDEAEEISYRPRTTATTITTLKPRASEVVVGVHEISEQELDDEVTEDEEEFDEDGMFALTRTTSHRPPSLCSDLSDEEDEEEESTPPSPESIEHRLPVSEKEFNEVSRSYFDQQLHTSSIHDDDQPPPMLFEERMGLSTMIAPVY